MVITALSTTHFNDETYRDFINKCNVFPSALKFRPLVDDKHHNVYDSKGAEITETVIEFSVVDPQPLTNKLIELGCKVLIDGKEQTAVPVV